LQPCTTIGPTNQKFLTNQIINVTLRHCATLHWMN
jgi:hypothetical protein